MTYTSTTPIRGTGRGDPDRIVDWAISRGALRPDDVAGYVRTVYALAPVLELNPDVVIAQSIHETAVNGVPWSSYWWEARCNPAGIGITGDPEQNARSRRFQDGEEAARAHLVHLSLYVNGARLPDGFSTREDPRWDAALAAGYAGIATTLADLTNRWGIDDGYAAKVARWLTALEAAGLLTADTPPEDAPMTTYPRKDIHVILVAGHRSVGDRGNATERELTDDLARAYLPAFRAAGYTVTWVNPTPTPGGLDGLALATARAIKAAIDAGAKLVLMLDLHFNGRRSGVHVVVAHNRRQDGRGMLSSGYAQSRVATDLATNNTLDVRMAEAIAREIAGIPGMTLMGGTKAIRNGDPTTSPAGVMLENRTGVGNNDGNAPDNARLAMMAATAPYLAVAVRLTIEHGGTDDAEKPDFFTRCAQAALRAVNATLADRIGDGTGGGVPIPDRDDDPEAPPTGDPGGPSLPAFLFGEADGVVYDPTPFGVVSRLWFERGKATGRWPRLVDVLADGPVKFYQFSDGSVIRVEGSTVAYMDEIAA